jgi:hypothetical protein
MILASCSLLALVVGFALGSAGAPPSRPLVDATRQWARARAADRRLRPRGWAVTR